MKDIKFAYLVGLPGNGTFWLQEGLNARAEIRLRGFYTVSYYDAQGKKIWEMFGILPQDIDVLIDNYALKPVTKLAESKQAE